METIRVLPERMHCVHSRSPAAAGGVEPGPGVIAFDLLLLFATYEIEFSRLDWSLVPSPAGRAGAPAVRLSAMSCLFIPLNMRRYLRDSDHARREPHLRRPDFLSFAEKGRKSPQMGLRIVPAFPAELFNVSSKLSVASGGNQTGGCLPAGRRAKPARTVGPLRRNGFTPTRCRRGHDPRVIESTDDT
jgi:hypothetical protein